MTTATHNYGWLMPDPGGSANTWGNTLNGTTQAIDRDEDQAFIPTDPDNTDYQQYLAWLDEGHEPTPYTPPPAADYR